MNNFADYYHNLIFRRNGITIDQHLAWPETRIGNILTFADRELPGWDGGYVHSHLFDWIAKAEAFVRLAQ